MSLICFLKSPLIIEDKFELLVQVADRNSFVTITPEIAGNLFHPCCQTLVKLSKLPIPAAAAINKKTPAAMIKTISNILFLAAIFFSCQNNDKGKDEALSETVQKQYSIKGDSIVKLTFDTLRSALLQKMKETGVAGAIEYCNINAYAITSLYAKEDIAIRRTAEKYRNPGNAPDSIEKIIFAHYKSLLSNKQPLENVVLESSGNIHYFKPIILQAMCRNCHGVPGSDIQPQVVEEIKRRYPADMATGFSEGDLRGIWHIRFPNR